MTKFNRTKKYLVLAAIFLLIVNVSLGIILTRQSSNAMKALMKGRMLDVSNTAASMIDGDVLRDITAEDKDTEGYRQILKSLTYFQENIDLKYIYCIRDMGNREFIFTVDPTVLDPAPFGESVVYTDALYEASLGHASVDRESYTDDWGRFYSAYSPVFDSAGKVAGIVAVDFSAEWYERQVAGQIWAVVIITCLSLSLGLAIVLMIVSRSRKRYRMLMEELNSLSDGIETLANELSDGEWTEGAELLHEDMERISASFDEVTALGEKIRSLQVYMSIQIDRVSSKAYRDGLTGLENRTAYNEYISVLNRQIENRTADFSVAMFDINGLKVVNDRQGHEKGDRLIVKASELLNEAFHGERIFRIGGDEFAVILGCIGEQAQRAMAGYEKVLKDKGTDEKGRVIMSSGFSAFDVDTDSTYQDPFSRADQLMYDHKKAFHEQFPDDGE